MLSNNKKNMLLHIYTTLTRKQQKNKQKSFHIKHFSVFFTRDADLEACATL